MPILKTSDFNQQDAVLKSLKPPTSYKVNGISLLKETEACAEFALENAQVGIWEWNIITNELVWSSVMFKLYGYDEPVSGICYEFWKNHVHPEDLSTAEQTLNSALEGNHKVDMMFRIICPNKSIRYLKCIAKIIEDAQGNPLKMIGTNWDLTGQIEQQLVAERAKIELETFFNLNVDFMCIANREGYLEKVNQAFYTHLGYSQSMIEENKFIHFIHPDDREASLEELKKLDYGVSIVNFKNRLKSKNNQWKWLSWSVTPDMATGKLYASARDISSLVKLSKSKAKEAALKKQKEVAEKITQIGNQFISQMSHEIRTPINGISGIVSYLNNDVNLSKTHKESLQIMDTCVKNLTEILNDILDLSKIQSGTFNLKMCETDLRSIVKHVVDLFKIKAENKGIELFFICPESTSNSIWTSKIRLTQVLMNLVSNAIKFTKKGSITIIVTLLNETNSSLQYKVEVKDTGVGVNGSHYNELFKAYSQLDNGLNMHLNGVGLGLSICKKIMSLMGGEIGVESSESGSNFWIVFSVNKADEISKPTELKNAQKKIYKEIKVLIVEDNLVNQKVLQMLLIKSGCSVYIVETGKAAIDMLKHQTFDIVFMDINLSGISGIETSKLIKSGFEVSPYIVGHGANVSDLYQNEIDNGIFDNYLAKPVQWDQLDNVLEACVSKRNEKLKNRN